MDNKRYNEITGIIIQCAIHVHRNLGPGLLESAYQSFLAHELRAQGLNIQEGFQQKLELNNKKIKAYFIDILVENAIVIELKSVEEISKVHISQILTYMKLGKFKLGLLLNFNVPLMKDGIQRFANRF